LNVLLLLLQFMYDHDAGGFTAYLDSIASYGVPDQYVVHPHSQGNMQRSAIQIVHRQIVGKVSNVKRLGDCGQNTVSPLNSGV
jgi:hypothetical protein